MSLNSDKDAMGAGRSSSSSAMLAHAPRLGNGGLGYAAWRTNMDVYLLRNGAENIHSVSMLESKWMEMSRRSATWQQEALDEAMALVLGDANNSSSDSSSLRW
jgi:hypothetical protein